jgi:hypothetical protein
LGLRFVGERSVAGPVGGVPEGVWGDLMLVFAWLEYL